MKNFGKLVDILSDTATDVPEVLTNEKDSCYIEFVSILEYLREGVSRQGSLPGESLKNSE